MIPFATTKLDADLIAAHKAAPPPWFPRDGLHREQVIVDVATLEAIALAAIRHFAESIRPSDQIGEIGTALDAAGLSDGTSLKKLSTVLFLLNLIDAKIHHDLGKLYEIRSIYAHKASVGQLDADPTMAKLVHDLLCYKSNRTALAELNGVGKVYRAIASHLRAGLTELTQQ